MEVSNAHSVVLLVEFPGECVEALGDVVDGAGVGWVQDVGLASSWECDVNVSLWDLPSRRSVAVDAHGSEVHNVSVEVFGSSYPP